MNFFLNGAGVEYTLSHSVFGVFSELWQTIAVFGRSIVTVIQNRMDFW